MTQYWRAGGEGFPKPVTWKEKEESAPNIRNGKMCFVNRENALQQLQDIHSETYKRALEKAGSEWTIPICDNIFGLGKTEFALQYIKRVSELPQSSAQDLFHSEFRNVLRQAHTVHIVIEQGALSDEKMFEDKLLTLLQNELRTQFIHPPACLYESYESTRDFLSVLISEVGPVFVALDEIGRAFDFGDKTDMERRNLFPQFCLLVLQGWFSIPGLFFLVLGRASFMNLVGCRPGNIQISTASPCTFRRLSLQFLRPKSIEEILRKTYAGDKTLFDYYKLTEDLVEEVALRLFSQTTGNPRFLIQAFTRCRTYEELKQSAGRFQITNYDEFYNYIIPIKDDVNYLIQAAASNNVVDLSSMIVSRERSISLEIVAKNAFIAWEMDLEAAQLIVSETTTKFFAAYFLPLKDFLDLILKNSGIPLDFPEAFAIMLMKRFQEMFVDKICPKDVLPSFVNTPCLGSLQDLILSTSVRPMPRMMIGGAGRRLQDTTADWTAWPGLLKEMDAYPLLCLKPPPKSASPDAIFVGDVNIGSKNYRYTLGIAAKNFLNTEAIFSMIADECKKFNAMFVGSDMKCRINILIFCATNYGPELKRSFGSEKFFLVQKRDMEVWKYVNEVIVIDLSSKNNRAEFFGLKTGNPLNQAIELVISKYSTIYTEGDNRTV